MRKGLRGTQVLQRNLQRILRSKVRTSMQGLIRAAAYVRVSMDTVPPLIPVDTGVLRASWYITPLTGMQPRVEMGFRAHYARYVHDRAWRKGSRPGAGPKFLESALIRNKSQIRKIIAAHTR